MCGEIAYGVPESEKHLVALGGPQPQGFPQVGAGRDEVALLHEVLAEVLEGEVAEFQVVVPGVVEGLAVERVAVCASPV
ncbi:hypothetical protein Sros01_68070 [Streptomyces roseochromogenus]|nr:hypothetical protein Sros01_68070 [Streptomyces roseochromogenus]